ncbi:hypothetical protein BC828DRAFT_377368 [Blastocladiella britannica]|nr:hypothetical protein BC828DRAFT_377368 [Blastocladiella britannica]
MAESLRRDHRIQLRVVEARFSSLSSEVDVFAVVKVHYVAAAVTAAAASSISSPSMVTGPTSPLPPDPGLLSMAVPPVSGLRKMSLIVQRQTREGSVSSAKGAPAPPPPVFMGKTPNLRIKDTAFFDHEMDLELKSDIRYVEVELWQKRMLKDLLLGSVILTPDQLRPNKVLEKWFPLKSLGASGNSSSISIPSLVSDTEQSENGSVLSSLSRGTGTSTIERHSACSSSTGITIRIRTLYWNDHLLPIHAYTPLVGMLVDQRQHISLCLSRSVDEDRDEAARTLVHVMTSLNLTDVVLMALCNAEIEATTDPALLFRANSVASKAMDQYLKLSCRNILETSLRPIIKSILQDNRSCELDKSRIDMVGMMGSATSSTGSRDGPLGGGGSAATSADQQHADNLAALSSYLEWTVERIVSSLDDTPPKLRKVFSSLQAFATTRWPDHKDVGCVAVGSFIFLRLFNAAVLGPKLFGLCDVLPSPNAARTLTLLSKSLQQLANGILFDGAKEAYMCSLNATIKSLIPKVREYLQRLATEPVKGQPPPPISTRSMDVDTGHYPQASLRADMGSIHGSAPSLSPDARDIQGSKSPATGGQKRKFAGVRKMFSGAASPSSPSLSVSPITGSIGGGISGGAGGSEHKLGGSGHLHHSKIKPSHTRGSIVPPSIEQSKENHDERYFSDLLRLLLRSIDAMQRNATAAETPSMNRLAIILRDITTVKERRMSSIPSNALLDAMSRAQERAGQMSSPLTEARASMESMAGDPDNDNDVPVSLFVADWLTVTSPGQELVTSPLSAGTISGVTQQQGTSPPTSPTYVAESGAAAFAHAAITRTSGSSRSRTNTGSSARSGLFRGFSAVIGDSSPRGSRRPSNEGALTDDGALNLSTDALARASGPSAPIRQGSAPILIHSHDGN